MKIQIRSILTEDVKIAQKALESIEFVTTSEGNAVDAYWVELRVPQKFLEMFPQFEEEHHPEEEYINQLARNYTVVNNELSC